jgi:hypothetical protein
MTLTQLREGLTYEELWLWHAYYQMRSDEQEAAFKKAKTHRR